MHGSTSQREEEEYTNRIIHYFNMGILTQPEGSTLRSYLADKLNCDPMRITKKYAANSCLGKKRAYHLCPRYLAYCISACKNFHISFIVSLFINHSTLFHSFSFNNHLELKIVSKMYRTLKLSWLALNNVSAFE
jgi:hypothetical protein